MIQREATKEICTMTITSNELEKSISFVLSVWGGRLDPNNVSSALGLTPTRSYRGGDASTSRAGKTRVQKCGYWELVFDELTDENLALRELGLLIEKLGSSKINIDKVPGIDGIEVSFFLYSRDNSSIDFRFATSLLGEIARLGIGLRVVVY